MEIVLYYYIYSICILLCVYTIVHYNRKDNYSKYFYEISNSVINNTIIALENKNYPPFKDIDLTLPHFIKYKILINNINIFNSEIIIATFTSPNNFKKRYSFRYNSKYFCNNTIKCKIIFFMGCSTLKNQYLIERELSLYNDIVQFSFKNSYLNLTLLSIMAIKYCYKRYNKIKYYIKTDDDIYINYNLLFNSIKIINPNNKVVYGHIGYRKIVNRNKKSKDYIPYFEYHYDYIPKYVYGALIIVTKTALKLLYNQTLYKQYYIWREDINIGMLCSKAGINVMKFPNNIDIMLRSNKCKSINTVVASEISSFVDSFYCL